MTNTSINLYIAERFLNNESIEVIAISLSVPKVFVEQEIRIHLKNALKNNH